MITAGEDRKIPAGYKQTDIGVIPADWKISAVGREFEIQLGKMLDSEKNTGIPKPYLGNKAVQWNRIDIDDLPMVAMSRADLERYRLRPGDLLVCEGGEVGRAAIWEAPLEECYYQKALHRLRPRHGFNTRLLLALLRYWTDRDMLGNYVSQTSIAHLTREKLAEVPLPVPTSEEQQTVVTALSDADALIEGLEKLIAKKRTIKQGVMQELLTGKRRLPGFNSKWKTQRLGDIFRVTRGQVLAMTKTTEDRIGEYQYPVYSSQTKESGLAGYYKDYLFENCITWTTDGAHAGDVKYRPGKFYCTNVCGVLESNEGYSNPCVAGIFNSVSRKYVSYVGNPKLMNNVVAEIRISIPNSIDEQIAIASVLSDMDSEIDALEQRLVKYKALKQGMMQMLLTGKIRLPH